MPCGCDRARLRSHIDIPFVTRDGVNYEWQAFHAGDFVVQNTLVCVGHFLPLLFHAELPKSERFVARDLNGMSNSFCWVWLWKKYFGGVF